MSDCRCKGKGKNELFCKCENTPITFTSVNIGAEIIPFITLTTDKLLVTEKDWVAKIDSMVVIQADTPSPLNLFYEIARITENTKKILCTYNFPESRDGQFTLTPNNTVCDEPGIGCHRYRLFVSGQPLQGTLNFTCRCINVTTFQKVCKH
ncbi:hypothetical protein V1503_05085 [Bacillus sp. SCS-151]|uniref:hypothetical protein n=1 Tax=Nanhaiella sioensis TaxID=3115293 RepID=UPI00397BDD5E